MNIKTWEERIAKVDPDIMTPTGLKWAMQAEIDELRQAIEQAGASEPVAWMAESGTCVTPDERMNKTYYYIPLYLHPTAPAQPELNAADAKPSAQIEWPEFEPWAEYVSMDISKNADGYYNSITTDMAWQAWEMAKHHRVTVNPPANPPPDGQPWHPETRSAC